MINFYLFECIGGFYVLEFKELDNRYVGIREYGLKIYVEDWNLDEYEKSKKWYK